MTAEDQYSNSVLKAVSKLQFNVVEGGVEQTLCHEWTEIINPIKLITLSRSDMKLRLKLVLTGSYLRGPTMTVVYSSILRVNTSNPCVDVLNFSFQMLQHLHTFLRPSDFHFLNLDDISSPTLRLSFSSQNIKTCIPVHNLYFRKLLQTKHHRCGKGKF